MHGVDFWFHCQLLLFFLFQLERILRLYFRNENKSQWVDVQKLDKIYC